MNFSNWMDLRIDYAFKLFFAESGTNRLVSLLNAIFANKAIPRVITSLTITNPSLNKRSQEDKLSILDIRAALSDGSFALIEMHLYGLDEFKHKAVRNWAKVYGEHLEQGEDYTYQRPVICISFIDGSITDAHNIPIEKVHALFQIQERDSHQILLKNMELHFIDMHAFVQQFQEAATKGTLGEDMFTNWLALITHAKIRNKEALAHICYEVEEIKMAAEVLTRFSEETMRRLEYESRMEDWQVYKNKIAAFNQEIADANCRAEESNRRAEESDREAAELRKLIATMSQIIQDNGIPLPQTDET